MIRISFVAALAALVLLAGCAALVERQMTARVTIQYATLKVIQKSSSISAADVRSHVERVRAVVDHDSAVTLAAIAQAARDGINWNRLSAADTMLLRALLDEIERELSARIGEGVISGEARMTIHTLLDWVQDAAGLLANARDPQDYLVRAAYIELAYTRIVGEKIRI